MWHSTVIKSVLASIIVLGAGNAAGNAQDFFFGMMPEQTPAAYHVNAPHEMSVDQERVNFRATETIRRGARTGDDRVQGS